MSLQSLTNSILVHSPVNYHVRAYKTCGSDLFLGALVTVIDDQEVDLVAIGERVEGIIIGQAYPTDYNLDHDYDNPFPDNTWVHVYTGFGEAWCWIGMRYQLVNLHDVIGQTYEHLLYRFADRSLINQTIDQIGDHFVQSLEYNSRSRVLQEAQIQFQNDIAPPKPHEEQIFFKISDLITLQLKDQKTFIYVKGKRFNQCKFLLLNLEEGKKYKEIESIDQAAEELSREMEHDHTLISPETEFWGHCSNLQAWYENDYDLNLIHTNLGFPLIRELIKYDDKKALIRFKEQIMERIEKTGINTYKMFKEDIKTYFNEEEIQQMDILLDGYLEKYKKKLIEGLIKTPLYKYIKLRDDISFQDLIVDLGIDLEDD